MFDILAKRHAVIHWFSAAVVRTIIRDYYYYYFDF